MSKRLFVSVDLDGLAEEVAGVQALFEDTPGLRLTDPEQAHITMQFLGDTPAGRVDDIVDAMTEAVAAADVGQFTAEFGGLGVFPSMDYISVVWLGVERGGEELTRLHDALEPRLVELGFDGDDHEFTPHVTLARMEHAGGKEHVQKQVRSRSPSAGSLTVDQLRVTESELTDDGPRYSTLAGVDL